MHLVMPPPVEVLPSQLLPTPTRSPSYRGLGSKRSHAEAFCHDIERKFSHHTQPSCLLDMSAQLRSQFHSSLKESSMSMLPSFNHTLPTGEEEGSYLALDVGGSTFRIALVKLNGRSAKKDAFKILKRQDYRIDDNVRSLQGLAFFDWMAEKIQTTFAGDDEWIYGEETLPMGLAWSFPVEQRSIRDGALLQMGKNFKAIEGLLGENLADLITDACQKKGLNVQMEAIVNDSSASLLSRAYTDSSTRIALILGTGLNAGVHLPVTCFKPQKFGRRPSCWRREAHHVVVNSELSMFGRDVFPLTKWDELLRRNHSMPDFQPLEYLVSGRYIPEITRLVLVEAIHRDGLFGGEVPTNFGEYEFATQTMAAIEEDRSPNFARAIATLQFAHPKQKGHPYTTAELRFVQTVAKAVSSRAAAYLAASLHAMLVLRAEVDGQELESEETMCIGCEGSMVEKYPRFMQRVQQNLDAMFGREGQVKLEPTYESSLLGAAVAVSCQHS